jgi:uncharacterized protein DUF5907
MTETTLNQFVSSGTNAERLAYTPVLATPAAGNDPSVVFAETDTGDTYMWNFGGAAWVKIAEGGSVNAITALTGDVTATGPGSVAATIANNAVTTAKILDDNVTLAKVANAAANDKLLGSGNAGSGANYVEITLGSGLTMTGTTLSASGSGGSVTTTGSPASGNLTKFSGATSITNGDLSGDVTTSATLATTLATPLTPGGRLTLTSNTPVLTADATAQGTVYYAPYVHARVPLYTGSVWAMRAFSQLTLTLNATDNVSGSLYDIFVVDVSGTLTLGTAPAWTNTTTRADAIALLNGIWTNNASIALRANGSALTGSPFAANTATYLGTIYCTANGQTGMAFLPAAASGGTNNILGLYNAYNRVRVAALCRDNATSWTYSTATWQALHANNSNRVSYVDGLAQSTVEGFLTVLITNATGSSGSIGMSLDSTSANPQVAGTCAITNATSQSTSVEDRFAPALGLHFIQAQEAANTGSSITFNGAAASPTRQWEALRVSLDM